MPNPLMVYNVTFGKFLLVKHEKLYSREVLDLVERVAPEKDRIYSAFLDSIKECGGSAKELWIDRKEHSDGWTTEDANHIIHLPRIFFPENNVRFDGQLVSASLNIFLGVSDLSTKVEVAYHDLKKREVEEMDATQIKEFYRRMEAMADVSLGHVVNALLRVLSQYLPKASSGNPIRLLSGETSSKSFYDLLKSGRNPNEERYADLMYPARQFILCSTPRPPDLRIGEVKKSPPENPSRRHHVYYQFISIGEGRNSTSVVSIASNAPSKAPDGNFGNEIYGRAKQYILNT
ncbi:MAG TPA: hypothetical protein VJI46_03315 [Candidatus Nanoarchaeia archaeon]|nr:hypothetical protein [Candidatus Nanoarchaeia archaeon]